MKKDKKELPAGVPEENGLNMKQVKKILMNKNVIL